MIIEFDCPRYKYSEPARLDLGVRCTDRRAERIDVVRPMMALPIDEECRSARDAADIGRLNVLCDAGLVDVVPQVIAEAVDVEAELAGVADEIGRRELVLVREQEVVHLPEGALCAGSLSSLGGELSTRVDVGER